MRTRATSRSAAYSLVEVMIAAGVLALATGGIYGAFLQANSVASNARSLTAARYILQRAADQALTASWNIGDKSPTVDPVNGHLPEALDIHYPSDDVQTSPQPYRFPGWTDNSVVLLADPHSDPTKPENINNQIITAQIFRQAMMVNDSGNPTTDPTTLIKIIFTLKYQVNGVDRPPQTLTIIRSRD